MRKQKALRVKCHRCRQYVTVRECWSASVRSQLRTPQCGFIYSVIGIKRPIFKTKPITHVLTNSNLITDFLPALSGHLKAPQSSVGEPWSEITCLFPDRPSQAGASPSSTSSLEYPHSILGLLSSQEKWFRAIYGTSSSLEWIKLFI